MNTPVKSIPLSAEALQFRRALEECMRRHATTLDAIEILAILSHLVGQVVAVQDQRTVTPEMAMDIVSKNLVQGNSEAIAALLNETGGHA